MCIRDRVVAVEPGGERCFFHVPGATTLLDAAIFRRCFDLFGRCDWVQIGYFGLLPALTGDLPDLLAQLKRQHPRTRVALDTVNPPDKPELLWPILPHLDLFAPSRAEAQALTGLSDPVAMIASFRQHMPRGIIGIKLDSAGCVLDDAGAQVMCPAYPIECIDTTGAGDTWFGALLVARQRGMNLDQAGRFANRAAADCCSAIGASTGIRSFDQTLARAT
jgi:sugar/nucleoside kinase (ribokinase family)